MRVLYNTLIALLSEVVRLTDENRKQLKTYLTYVMWWLYGCVAGHLVIELIWKEWMNPVHVVWTFIYFFVSLNIAWLRGGEKADLLTLYVAVNANRREQVYKLVKSWYWNLVIYFTLVFYLFPIGGVISAFAALMLCYAGAQITGHAVADSRKLKVFHFLVGVTLVFVLVSMATPRLRRDIQGRLIQFWYETVEKNTSRANMSRAQAAKYIREEKAEGFDELVEQFKEGKLTHEDFQAAVAALEKSEQEEVATVTSLPLQTTPPPQATLTYPQAPAGLHTPTGVEVTQLDGERRRIAFPPNQDWQDLGSLADGETASPDPESRFWCHPAFGVTGPNGSGKLATPEWRGQLPDGQKPFCAIALEVEGSVAKATVNDFDPHAVDVNKNGVPDEGRADNLGAPAIIIQGSR